MLKLHKKIVVKAPIAKVFEYVEKPEHLPEIWPGLFEVKEIERIPTGGHRFAWLYNMVGKPIKGKIETAKFEDGKLIVDRAMGDVEGTFAWKFTGVNGTTEVVLESEFEPKAFLPKEELAFFEKRNEFEAETILENLKLRLEV